MSYVITIHPCPTKFVGDMVDMIISTDAQSLDFSLVYDEETIIEEEYVAAQGTVRVGGLRKVIDGILRGQMIPEGGQDYMKGNFSFVIDGAEAFNQTLYISKHRNMEYPTGNKNILSHGRCDVCYPGIHHPLTFISYNNVRFNAKLCDAQGNILDEVQPQALNVPYTEECMPDNLFFNIRNGAKIIYTLGNETFISYIDKRSYPDAVLFRFLNIYDAPETLLAKKAMSVKPNSTDEIGVINGEQKRFGIEGDDEYMVESGALMFQDQYLQWRDLMMSREVQVYYKGSWLPIIVIKPNYQQSFRKATLDGVSFSFKMANKQDSLI